MSEETENQEQTNSGKIIIQATPENSKKLENAFADAKTVQEANRALLQKVEKYEKMIEDATKEAREKKIIERFYPQPAPVGGSREEGYFTAPLNPTDDHTLQLENDDTVPLSWQKFESEADFYQKLADKKRNDPQNKEVLEIEAQLSKKMGHNWEIELVTDDSKCLYRSEKPVTPDLSPAERQSRLAFNRELKAKRSNWRLV